MFSLDEVVRASVVVNDGSCSKAVSVTAIITAIDTVGNYVEVAYLANNKHICEWIEMDKVFHIKSVRNERIRRQMRLLQDV